MAAKGHIEIDEVMCKGCEVCIAFCPKKSLSVSDKINAAGYFPAAFSDGADCTGCAICAVVCPEAAIEVWRE